MITMMGFGLIGLGLAVLIPRSSTGDSPGGS
jgi:hypothetical protein